MTEEFSFNNIDSLLFQFALQTRELSQKKNELNQQIKACRADIAERRVYIEAIQRNIKKLEEEIRGKQNTVLHNKAAVKSIKTTNSLLLQYEQTLKAELERRKASYSHDMEVYEEKITSCSKMFQSHQEYYFQNPLAQKLLMLQSEKEEIESRLKACEDQIKMKQKEFNCLSGPDVSSFSSEKLPDSGFGQQPITEQEKQLHHQEKGDWDSSIDISFLPLNHTRNGHETSAETNAEEIPDENPVQDSPASCTSSDNTSKEQWSCRQLDKLRQPDEIHFEEQDQETSREDSVLEQQSTVSGVQEVLEGEMQEGIATDEEQAHSKESSEGLTVFTLTSLQGTNSESFPAKITAVPSTPTFSFNLSPANSPLQGTHETKSPLFPFSLNSTPNTPGFPGFRFGFEKGSSQEEDSPFAFTASFFNEKKTTDEKSSDYPEFLFGQSEQSEDFQFPFSVESPQSAHKEDNRQDFSFSFNF